MTPDETPRNDSPAIPPQEQILPTGGLAQEDEPTQGGAAPESVGAAAQQAQSLAREKPVPIALAGAFVAGVVVGRIASRR